MPSVTPQIRYLLNVWFEDGTIIRQDDNDVSKKDPTKSFWFDVVSDPRNVIKMELCPGRRRVRWYGVEFLTGKFHVDGIEFEAQPCVTPPMPQGGVFKPVYYRDNSVKMIQGPEGSRIEHSHRYRIGWIYEFGDKTFEQTIVID